MKQSSKKTALGTAALYCRLSRDDNMDNESNSIQNQELICKGWFLPSNTYVEIVCYGTDGETLEVLTVTSENPKAAICYEAGGQMLASKLLRFLWE